MKGIYVLFDRVAHAVVGSVAIMNGDAAAVRMFGDVLADNGSMQSRYPKDFSLLCCGLMEMETGVIDAQDVRVVMTGEQWLAAQPAAPTPLRKEA